MKAREIYKKIRKIYMRNILLPIAAIVFPLGLLVFLPFDKVLEPKVVSSTEEAIEAIEVIKDTNDELIILFIKARK